MRTAERYPGKFVPEHERLVHTAVTNASFVKPVEIGTADTDSLDPDYTLTPYRFRDRFFFHSLLRLVLYSAANHGEQIGNDDF